METPVLAAWDAAVRAWLVLATWLALRGAARPDRLARLATITDPRRFVRAAIVPAAGHVAIAIAMLPRRRRGEATITLLVCKALRALDQVTGLGRPGAGVERATVQDAVVAAVAYLCGEAHEPPRIDRFPRSSGSQSAVHPSDRVDAMLAARLPVLRAALELLPGDAVRRCRAMIERVGEAIVRGRTERRGGSGHVLGEAVVYAARLAAPSVRPPDVACRAAGRALQIIDDLHHAETTERRAWLVSRTLPAASEVTRLARWLPAGVGPGTRASAALLVVTSCAALLAEAGVALPRRLRRPLRAALAAAGSHAAYLAAATAVDGAIREALTARPSLLDGAPIVLARAAAPAPAGSPTGSPIGSPVTLAVGSPGALAVGSPAGLAALALVPPRGSDAGEPRELDARIGS